jgi:hypothetical protein
MPKLSVGKILTRGLAVIAIAAVAGFGTLTLSDTSALARGGSHGGPSGGGGHGMGAGHSMAVGHSSFGVRGGAVRGGVIRGGPRGRFGRGGRHFWHGHWWWPGVGPCWRWTPWGWIWICGP